MRALESSSKEERSNVKGSDDEDSGGGEMQKDSNVRQRQGGCGGYARKWSHAEFVGIAELPADSYLRLADGCGLSNLTKHPYIFRGRIFALRVLIRSRNPKVDRLIAIEATKGIGRDCRDGKIKAINTDSLLSEIGRFGQLALRQAMAENGAVLYGEPQRVCQIRSDSGDDRDLCAVAQRYFGRCNAGCVDPIKCLGCVLQYLVFTQRERA